MPPKSKQDLLQGTLDLLILRTLATHALHGYAIAQRITAVSGALLQVPQGSLYPALHRLENRGYVSATWDQTETGREAKFYKLTRTGRLQLDRAVADWQRLSDGIGLVLSGGAVPGKEGA
jgi:transcriptional regulator